MGGGVRTLISSYSNILSTESDRIALSDPTSNTLYIVLENMCLYTYKDNAWYPFNIVPIKGIDYWTSEDKEDIIQEVITALGTPVFGRVDEDNNIILTGELVYGTYTLKYEDSDGNLTEIGTLVYTEVAYTNWIPLSTEVDGVTLYNGGLGYKENTRWSSSGGGDIDATGIYVSGYIPVSVGDIIRIKNITMNKNDTTGNMCNVCYFNSLGTGASANPSAIIEKFDPVWDDDDNLVQFTIPNWDINYIRLNTAYIGDNSILTINEEIEITDESTIESCTVTIEWDAGVKIDKTTGAESSSDTYAASQHFQITEDGYYTFSTTSSWYNSMTACYYDSDGNYLGYVELYPTTDTTTDDYVEGEYEYPQTAVVPGYDGAATFRLRAYVGGGETQLSRFSMTYTTGDSDTGDTTRIIALTWADGIKLDKTTGAEGSGEGYSASQSIEVVDGYAYTVHSNVGDNIYNGITICFYGAEDTYLGYTELWAAINHDTDPAVTIDMLDGTETIRLRGYFSTAYNTSSVTLSYEKNET